MLVDGAPRETWKALLCSDLSLLEMAWSWLFPGVYPIILLLQYDGQILPLAGKCSARKISLLKFAIPAI